MRKPYLDNIRWGTVLLVMVYHVFYAFNACGVLGGVGHFADVQYQDALLYVCYPWFMVLLFLVAGICSRYSLDKRSHKEFIRTRTRKLLVPCTVGLIAFQWITGIFNVLASGGFETMRDTVPDEAKPFAYTITCILSGIGPMWFIQMLWLFSLLLVLIRKLDKKDVLWKLGEKANIPVILLLFLPMWGAAQILNTPVITVYRFGIYGLAYFLVEID